ncbi:MAG: YbdD/YjiX family protein [Firmicutes bacterium]|nr:YbdD/YjiX family protein [Bacillota bacterium]
MRTSALRFGRKLWWYLRQVSGDAAYENYLRCAEARLGCPVAPPAGEPGSLPHRWDCCGGAPLLSAEQFYLDVLRRRYSGISRCC